MGPKLLTTTYVHANLYISFYLFFFYPFGDYTFLFPKFDTLQAKSDLFSYKRNELSSRLLSIRFLWCLVDAWTYNLWLK